MGLFMEYIFVSLPGVDDDRSGFASDDQLALADITQNVYGLNSYELYSSDLS